MSWGRMYSNSTVVSVSNDPSVVEEMTEWVRSNSRGEVEIHPVPVGIAKVLFEFEDDAIFFTLKWGGKI